MDVVGAEDAEVDTRGCAVVYISGLSSDVTHAQPISVRKKDTRMAILNFCYTSLAKIFFIRMTKTVLYSSMVISSSL